MPTILIRHDYVRHTAADSPGPQNKGNDLRKITTTSMASESIQQSMAPNTILIRKDYTSKKGE